MITALVAATPAFAQQAPTRAEQLACRADAQNFCREHIGNPPQMNACLKSNMAKLSESCRRVVEARAN